MANTNYIPIYKVGKTKLTSDFANDDFWAGNVGNQPNATSPHSLFYKIPAAAQLVSDTLGGGVTINSTVRFPGGSKYNGGKSQHDFQQASAIDLGIPESKRAQVWKDILIQGPLFRALFDMGARGFGLYDSWLHIDFRSTGSGSKSFNGQKYAFWDNRSIANKPALTAIADLSVPVAEPDEDERPLWQKLQERSLAIAWWIVMPTLVIAIFWLIRKYFKPSK